MTEVMGRVLGIVYRCIGRYLERQGLLERDAQSCYLAGDDLEAGPMAQLLGSSITYRIAVGPHQGRKVFTLRTLPGCEEPFEGGVGKVAGSSLHAGVAARADQRHKLERLCRYISRPAISEQRLSLTPNGNVRYQLKTPYRDGTTHVCLRGTSNSNAPALRSQSNLTLTRNTPRKSKQKRKIWTIHENAASAHLPFYLECGCIGVLKHGAPAERRLLFSSVRLAFNLSQLRPSVRQFSAKTRYIFAS